MPDVEFRKVAYAPWKLLRPGDPRWANTYLFRPFAPVDLFHLWNGVCFNRRPWIASFEAHFPRYCGRPRDRLYEMSVARIQSKHCRALLGLSDFACNYFLLQNRDLREAGIGGRCQVAYGAIPVDPSLLERHHRWLESPGRPLVVSMIGHEFFRKGGVGVVRALEQLVRSGADVRLTLVSRVLGGDYVTETPPEEVAALVTQLQEHPWIDWHPEEPYGRVLELLCESHVCVLPTLDETFGWSAVEAMSVGVPVISTNVCAMPETVKHGRSGFLIELPLQEDRRWVGMGMLAGSNQRREQLERAHECIEAGVAGALEVLLRRRELCQELGEQAVAHVRRQHDPDTIARQVADIYRLAVT